MARPSSSRSSKKNTRNQSRSGAQRRVSDRGSKPVYGQPRRTKTSAAILDDQTKRDIAGVVLIVLALALFVTIIMTPAGVVTSAVSEGLRLAFGAGLYLLPIFLLVVAITILVRFEKEHVPLRVTLGICLIYLAILTIMAAYTGGAEQDPNALFNQAILIGRGGYVGAGIAWLFLTLFGLTVTVILMVGLALIGCIIIGFSISALIEKIRSVHQARLDSFEFEELQDDGEPRVVRARNNSSRSGFFARLQRKQNQVSELPTQVIEEYEDSSIHDAQTMMFESDTEYGEEQPMRASMKTRKLSGRKQEELADAETLEFEDLADETLHAQNTIALVPTEEVVDDGNYYEAAETAQNVKQASAPKKAKKQESFGGPKPQEGFELPPMSLLKTSKSSKKNQDSERVLKETAQILADTLAEFGINAQVVDWVAGPTVTLFKVDLPSGVRVNRITNLSDDIALALAAPGVRIFAPVPGTNYVGIEVPNKKRETVLLGDILKEAHGGPLQIAIGKDVEGECILSDLAKMPHLLIGGTTGSGKSISINGMIMSILMRATPAEVRFIMIDPKRVEFYPYNGIPHLYVPVVTEAREAASALAWGVAEMERRLKVFSQVGARNISQYNAKVQAGDLEEDTEELPYIVIIIDELADLMMNVGKEVEFSISRLAQLARAAGIHLIVATQRPSTNVVTGLIKANITNRIALNVASGIDSRVILDQPGAENLIGLGDLLLSKPELAKPQRIQGCYVSEEEIEAVVELLKAQGEPEYHNDILKTNIMSLGDTNPDGSGGGSGANGDDPLLWDAAEIVCSSGMGSTSNLQRRLSVGYARAGRIMDLLEAKGIVGPPNGSKPREVLVDPMELETLKAFEMNDEL